jgi:hypothetical protein
MDPSSAHTAIKVAGVSHRLFFLPRRVNRRAVRAGEMDDQFEIVRHAPMMNLDSGFFQRGESVSTPATQQWSIALTDVADGRIPRAWRSPRFASPPLALPTEPSLTVCAAYKVLGRTSVFGRRSDSRIRWSTMRSPYSLSAQAFWTAPSASCRTWPLPIVFQ